MPTLPSTPGEPIARMGSGGPWEPLVGYCRAVRAGALVIVSGTTSDTAGDMATQARSAMGRVLAALEGAGAGPADVIQTRLFVTDIGAWEAVAAAHRGAFGAAPPAATMVEVAALIDPALLIEVEAMAWVGERGAPVAAGDGSQDYAGAA